MKPSVDNKTIRITELISAIIFALTSLFLTLVGLKVFSFSIGESWLITVEVCLFAISAVVALLQKNDLGWAACGMLVTLIAAEILVLVGFTHARVYPFYFLALPVGLVAASISARRFGLVFKIALIFTAVGLMLFLQSFGLLSVEVALPAIAFLLGVTAIVYSVVKLRSKGRENKK